MSGSRAKRGRLAALLLAAIALFLALGVWQVQRRAWKLRLIAAVDQRVHQDPRPAPAPAEWPRVSFDTHAYAHVRVHGRYDTAHEALVQAVTDLGGGFWVLTPLVTDGGWTVLVNRGFVPSDQRARTTHLPPAAPVTVTGLLRLTEPKGGFLRSNDPAHDRWYSRDVPAIAAADRLTRVAPYFIDAGPTPPGTLPVGGLTVIAFANNHLQYALTWFAMAVLSAAGLWVLLRDRPRAA